ncbi:MAG: hypothetical protein ABSA62_14350 [Methyloceanibacter sp.]
MRGLSWSALCLDVATKLEAGGDVGDKDLGAARQACGRAEQSVNDPAVKPKLDAGSSTINDESARRHRLSLARLP